MQDEISPPAADRQPHGIVIRHGRVAQAPAAVWAYLWTADDDAAAPHWHELVPAERGGPAPRVTG